MCAIMPERLANTDPFKSITEVIGSGPFRFKADERVSGSLYVCERFTDYKPREDGEADFVSGPKAAHFDRVEWHINPDQASVTGALQSGEIDWTEYAYDDLRPMLRRDSRVTLQRVGSTGFWGFMRPNHLFPPFDNPAIRRALMGAIDQTEFMTAVIGPDPSDWRVPTGFFPLGSPMASDEGLAAFTGPRDLGRVRRDLEAAGYRGEKIKSTRLMSLFSERSPPRSRRGRSSTYRIFLSGPGTRKLHSAPISRACWMGRRSSGMSDGRDELGEAKPAVFFTVGRHFW